MGTPATGARRLGGPQPRRGRTRAALAALLLAGGLVAATGPDGAAAVLEVAPGATTATIQAALDAAEPGDTVQLAAGTYALDGSTPLTVPPGITLAGAGRDAATGTVLFRSASAAALVVGGDGVTLRDLRVAKGGSIDTSSNLAVVLGGLGSTTATLHDLTMEGLAVTGAAIGVHVISTVSVVGWTVRDSEFTGNRIAWNVEHKTAVGSTVDGLDVTDVAFRDNTRKGCYFEKLERARFERVRIEASGTAADQAFNAGCDINLKWGAFGDLTFTDVTITGSGLPGGGASSAGAALTIKARRDGSYAGPGAATLDGVAVDGLVTSGGQVGLRIGEPGTGNDGTTGVVVRGSDLGGTDAALVNLAPTAVVAGGNWWGQASGPAAGQVTGAVTVGSWCLDAACAAASDDARLTALSISPGSLSPAFDPATTTYAASVANSTNAVAVAATPAPGATVAVSGAVLANLGPNTVTITVTAADGTTTRTYVVTVVRAFPPPPPPTTTTTVPEPVTNPPILLPVIARRRRRRHRPRRRRRPRWSAWSPPRRATAASRSRPRARSSPSATRPTSAASTRCRWRRRPPAWR